MKLVFRYRNGSYAINLDNGWEIPQLEHYVELWEPREVQNPAGEWGRASRLYIVDRVTWSIDPGLDGLDSAMLIVDLVLPGESGMQPPQAEEHP